jgi:hypothetical protein
MRRSEVSAEACNIQYPAILAEVPTELREQCDMTPDTGCDPVTCTGDALFAFESAAGECDWCRHIGQFHDTGPTGRAPDGTCIY